MKKRLDENLGHIVDLCIHETARPTDTKRENHSRLDVGFLVSTTKGPVTIGTWTYGGGDLADFLVSEDDLRKFIGAELLTVSVTVGEFLPKIEKAVGDMASHQYRCFELLTSLGTLQVLCYVDQADYVDGVFDRSYTASIKDWHDVAFYSPSKSVDDVHRPNRRVRSQESIDSLPWWDL